MFVRGPRGPRKRARMSIVRSRVRPHQLMGHEPHTGPVRSPRGPRTKASYKHLRVSYGRKREEEEVPKQTVTGPVGFWKLLLDCFDTSERGASSESSSSDSPTPAVQSTGVSTWGFSSASSSCRLRFFVFAFPLFGAMI